MYRMTCATRDLVVCVCVLTEKNAAWKNWRAPKGYLRWKGVLAVHCLVST